MKTPERIQQLTATQRLEKLENAIVETIEAAQFLVQENSKLKAVIEDLEAKIEAIIKVQQIDAQVNEFIVNKNEQDLKDRVSALVEKGEIEPCETIGPETFVVALEKNDEGTITNPRIQFSMITVSDADLKVELIGKKTGDVFKYKTANVEILETYNQVKKE